MSESVKCQVDTARLERSDDVPISLGVDQAERVAGQSLLSSSTERKRETHQRLNFKFLYA